MASPTSPLCPADAAGTALLARAGFDPFGRPADPSALPLAVAPEGTPHHSPDALARWHRAQAWYAGRKAQRATATDSGRASADALALVEDARACGTDRVAARDTLRTILGLATPKEARLIREIAREALGAAPSQTGTIQAEALHNTPGAADPWCNAERARRRADARALPHGAGRRIARRLGVSPAALSQALARLRDTFGSLALGSLEAHKVQRADGIGC